MSKPIKMTDEMKAEILRDITARLDKISLFDGKFKFDIDYAYTGADKARLSFTRMAWRKQKRLVEDFASEVGWHGICKRDPEDPAHFIVEDIMVFPQTVTGATVTPSQEEYNAWNNSLSDEQFNNCRFHGHSHVNMATSPSGTDITFQKQITGRLEGDGFTEEAKAELLEQLGDTAFYVFLIINKRGEMTTRIRDMANNVEYESKEIEIIYEEDPDELGRFMQDAKQKVKTYTYNYGKGGNNYGGGNYGSGYGGYNYGSGKGSTPAIPPKSNTPPAQSPNTPATQASGKNDDAAHRNYPHGYCDGTEDWYKQFGLDNPYD